MEVDTGSAVSLISQHTQQKCFSQVNTAVVLQTYTLETMAVLGVMMVQVKYGEYVNTVSYMWSREMDLVCWDVPG